MIRSSTVRAAALALLCPFALSQATACSDDDCQTKSTCGAAMTSDSDAGTDAVAAAPDTSLSFDAIAPAPRVMQGGTLNVPLRLTRGKDQRDDVVVTVTDLPEGVTVEPLTIGGAESAGDLVVRAAESVKQGPLTARLRGVAGGVEATAELPLFVRGQPGSPDTTFGTDGRRINVTGAETGAYLLAVDAQDRIYVVNPCPAIASACITRLLPDGAPDPAYNGGAVITVAIEDPKAAALDSRGRLIVAGGTPPALARITADGALDTSFGEDDGVIHPSPPASDGIRRISVGPSDSVIVSYPNQANEIELCKFDSQGRADSSFGTAGCYTVRWDNSTELTGLQLQADNTVLVTGTWRPVSGNAGFAVGRILASGSGWDTTFAPPHGSATFVGSGGFIRSGSSNHLVVQQGGQIVTTFVRSVTLIAVRFGADGAPDPTFGTDALVEVGNYGEDLVATRDGKLLFTLSWPEGRDILVRLDADGKPDPTWGTDGTLDLPSLSDATHATPVSLALQSDGRILVGSLDGVVNEGGVLRRIWD